MKIQFKATIVLNQGNAQQVTLDPINQTAAVADYPPSRYPARDNLGRVAGQPGNQTMTTRNTDVVENPNLKFGDEGYVLRPGDAGYVERTGDERTAVVGKVGTALPQITVSGQIKFTVANDADFFVEGNIYNVEVTAN